MKFIGVDSEWNKIVNDINKLKKKFDRFNRLKFRDWEVERDKIYTGIRLIEFKIRRYLNDRGNKLDNAQYCDLIPFINICREFHVELYLADVVLDDIVSIKEFDNMPKVISDVSNNLKMLGYEILTGNADYEKIYTFDRLGALHFKNILYGCNKVPSLDSFFEEFRPIINILVQLELEPSAKPEDGCSVLLYWIIHYLQNNVMLEHHDGCTMYNYKDQYYSVEDGLIGIILRGEQLDG